MNNLGILAVMLLWSLAGCSEPQAHDIRNHYDKFSPGLQMVSIETGSMQVGATAKNFQAMPMKQVQITRGFMISATEITFEQYDLFSKATGRALVSDRGYGRGKKPVVNVSYDDAMAYVDWLSVQTGLSFSLPSEMQWLWAATGGLNHPHAILEKLSCQLANV